MEPNTTYRPPFYLGEKFIDGNKRQFEIIETHWGLPEDNIKGVSSTIELQNGHKINIYGSPDRSVLKEVSFRQIGNPKAVLQTQPVEVLEQLKEDRKIVMF